MPRPIRLAVLLCLLCGACANGSDPDATPGATPTITPGPMLECSARNAEVDEPPDLGALPARVATMRRDILAAARSCDYEALQDLARRTGDTFKYLQEGARRAEDVQPASYWRSREVQQDNISERLVRLLSTRWVTITEIVGSEPDEQELTVHMWPRAWDPEEAQDADWQALEDVYPAVDVAGWRSDRHYGGERVVITEEGQWIEFAPVARR